MRLQEKLEQLLKTVPFDEIRKQAYERLNEAGLLHGEGRDIHFMVLEQVDIFKATEMKDLKQQVWDIFFREIRKTLAHGVVEWTQKAVSEEFMMKELADCEMGEASSA